MSLQHWLDQADGNIANKSIDEKHKYKSTHEHNTYLGYQCGYITFGIYRKKSWGSMEKYWEHSG